MERLSYEGAKTGRRTGGWIASGTSADAEILPAQFNLRSRARELVRDNAYAAKALRVIRSSSVGTGIVAQSKDSKLQAIWDRWTSYCDADGHLDFYGIQGLIARTIPESGSVLVRLRARMLSDGFEIPLQLQVMEPDHIDTAKNGEIPGGIIRAGIEYNLFGQCKAYWLFPTHPGDSHVSASRFRGTASQRVPAESLLYAFEKLRPGQTHGVTWFAPSMLSMRDLADYEDAEIVRKRIEACFAGFITTQEGAEVESVGSAVTSAAHDRVEGLEPGVLRYLKNGESITFGDPKASGGYDSFVKARLHAIAAGIGVTYAQLTGDLSDSNYSNMRAGRLDFRSIIEEYRWTTLIPQVFTPCFSAVETLAVGLGLTKRSGLGVEWSPPRWEHVDPLKDATAEQLDVRNGFEAWDEVVRRRGYDPAKQREAIAATNKAFDDAGIVLDVDPRKVARGGVVQTQDPNALDTPAPSAAKASAQLSFALPQSVIRKVHRGKDGRIESVTEERAQMAPGSEVVTLIR